MFGPHDAHGDTRRTKAEREVETRKEVACPEVVGGDEGGDVGREDGGGENVGGEDMGEEDVGGDGGKCGSQNDTADLSLDGLQPA